MPKSLKQPTPEQVQRLRESAGMTASEFAELVYCEAPTVYAWESGRRQCPISSWELLLIYFGKTTPRRAAERV